MAKSYPIVMLAATAAAELALVPPTDNRGKLSNIVTEILASSIEAQYAVIDFSARKVFAGPVGVLDPLALIDAVTGTTKIESIKQVGDGTERTAEWVNEADSDTNWLVTSAGSGGNVLLVTKPYGLILSLAAVIDRIDDAEALRHLEEGATDPMTVGASGDYHAFLVIDQETLLVTLVTVAAANVATVRALNILDEAENIFEQNTTPVVDAEAPSEGFGL